MFLLRKRKSQTIRESFHREHSKEAHHKGTQNKGMDMNATEILVSQRRLYSKQYKKRDEMGREWCTGDVLEIGCGEFPILKDSNKIDIRKIDGVMKHNANEHLSLIHI